MHNCTTAVVKVVIEIPRWSFVKRGSGGKVDFIAPLPCPFNYGSIPQYTGLDGDLLDAVVLGPRLPRGTRIRIPAIGAVGLSERGLYDDKIICSYRPVSASERRGIVAFFQLYGFAKRFLNVSRGYSAQAACRGWSDPASAINRAARRNID